MVGFEGGTHRSAVDVPQCHIRSFPGTVRVSGHLMNKSSKTSPRQSLTTNTHLIRWIDKIAELCTPAAIHWVDGSDAEYEALCSAMVDAGTFIKLNQDL